MIHQLQPQQVHLCLEAGRECVAESGSMRCERWSDAIFLRNWGALIRSGSGVIFGLKVGEDWHGFIGGVIITEPNMGRRCGSEYFWHILKRHRQKALARGAGLKLLKAWEIWCSEQGAEFLVLGAMKVHSDEMAKLYPRLGYELEQTLWIRRASV